MRMLMGVHHGDQVHELNVTLTLTVFFFCVRGHMHAHAHMHAEINVSVHADLDIDEFVQCMHVNVDSTTNINCKYECRVYMHMCEDRTR